MGLKGIALISFMAASLVVGLVLTLILRWLDKRKLSGEVQSRITLLLTIILSVGAGVVLLGYFTINYCPKNPPIPCPLVPVIFAAMATVFLVSYFKWASYLNPDLWSTKDEDSNKDSND